MSGKRSHSAYQEALQKQEAPFVSFGTPLPPLDEHSRDDGSYVPVWKQEVTDDRGRKRLHGAFTGGFSAGYFNSVGSKEGWSPATFKSSRQSRAKGSNVVPQQRREDYMDEEDLREEEESKKLSTAAEYSGFGSTDEDTKRRNAFTDIFRPTGDTVGVRLLKRMGWKEGQGLGPKILRKPSLDELEDGDDGGGPVHLFAPKDPPMISFSQKLDRKGLGFVGEAHLETKSDRFRQNGDQSDEEQPPTRPLESAIGRGKRDAKTKKAAFGVGILNDTGSDDEDPYQMGPKMSYSRVMGGDKKVHKKAHRSQTATNPLLRDRHIFKSRHGTGKSGFRKCHDGRLPLDGFVLSGELDSFALMDLQDQQYSPPKVPEGWTSKKQNSLEHHEESYISTAETARNSAMDAKTRAEILGEAQLPGKSVFDFLTPTARDRIAVATGKSNLPAALGEKPEHGRVATSGNRVKDLQDLVPKVDSQVAMQALDRGPGGWMPYAEDEDKRSRYRAFLAVRAGIREGLPERKGGSSNDEWANEMEEFARAAQVFQPVSGLMASRFTSSSQPHRVSSDQLGSLTNKEELLNRPPEKPEDPAVKAARMGMFGVLTRSVENFYPTRLLCKRFNVKPPTSMQVDHGKDTNREAASQAMATSQSDSAGDRILPQGGAGKGAKLAHLHALSSYNEATPQLGTGHSTSNPAPAVNTEMNEALEGERPGEDVFRAIFGSDDEED